MSQPELVKKVVAALEAAGIGYFVTGSIASSLQGQPRATHDIDLVVALRPDGVDALVRAFPGPEFFLSEEAARSALRRGSMFNLIASETGDKVDFWILTGSAFDQSRFARRLEQDSAGLRFMVSSPEDTILAKLRWAKLSGGSEKQFRDALRVYEVQFKKLDQQYLARWAGELGLNELLKRIQSEAEPLA